MISCGDKRHSIWHRDHGFFEKGVTTKESYSDVINERNSPYYSSRFERIFYIFFVNASIFFHEPKKLNVNSKSKSERDLIESSWWHWGTLHNYISFVHIETVYDPFFCSFHFNFCSITTWRRFFFGDKITFSSGYSSLKNDIQHHQMCAQLFFTV